MEITEEPFGPPGCRAWTISNGKMTVRLTNYGATVLAVNLPNEDGKLVNVAPCHSRFVLLPACQRAPTARPDARASKLTFTTICYTGRSLCSYDALRPNDLGANPKMGTTCGRVCNRTAGGSFTIDGTQYQLAKNDGTNCLHGGIEALDRRVWTAECVRVTAGGAAVTLRYDSPHLEEGFPGDLTVRCTISLTAQCEMGVEYAAELAAGGVQVATPVALTNHCYWNLSPAALASGTVLDHSLQLHCDEHVPSNPVTYIPTGELAGVGTAAAPDFREPVLVGAAVPAAARDPTQGINMSYVVRGWKPKQATAAADAAAAAAAPAAPELAHLASVHSAAAVARLRPAGVLSHPASGRSLTVLTSHPCIHLYTCYAWDAKYSCEGVPLAPSSALALECQLPADCANQSFGASGSASGSGTVIPRAILRPGEEYRELTLHKFAWKGCC